jgi:ribosomal protein S27AE
MTKREFIEKIRAQEKQRNGCGIVTVTFFFIALVGNAYVARNSDSFSLRWKLVWGIAFCSFLLLPGPIAMWNLRREIRKFGLQCPACSKALLGMHAKIAIASSHCGHCGIRLFEGE